MSSNNQNFTFNPAEAYKPDNAPRAKGAGVRVATGVHLAMVVEHEFGFGKTSKKPYVRCDFEVIGPYDPSRGGVVAFCYYSLTSNARWKFGQLCHAIDPSNPVFNAADEAEREAVLYGKPLAITVNERTEKVNGEFRKRLFVARHRPINEREAEALRAAFGPAMVPDEEGAGDAIGLYEGEARAAGDEGGAYAGGDGAPFDGGAPFADDFTDDDVPF